jgi:primosomal protein N' (replication factor Y)
VLPILKSAQFDRSLTYRIPDGLEAKVGDVARIPLGAREAYGYVLGPGGDGGGGPLRDLIATVSAEPAFDREGLALAHWIALRYGCSLREALANVVHAAAVPRVVERFVPVRLEAPSLPSVPPRLVRLIWEDLREGFSIEALLRHPEARRAGDRVELLRALAALQRAGALRRVRSFAAARMREATELWLEPGSGALAGKRANALRARVNAEGSLKRSAALLEGYSPAVIARAVKTGALRTVERGAERRRVPPAGESQAHQATPEQAAAIAAIGALSERGSFAEVLLEGVTGSGKTLVYIEAIRRTIAEGGRAIVLVPEIALTPQTARRFEGAFGDRVAVLHSALSERERFDAWTAARRGEIDVVVGARSAVFAPLAGVRAIVVDEAHERSYKQEAVPRFHAVSIARRRMQAAGGVLVLGSATPSLESYQAARSGEIGRLRLTARATAQALPRTRIVDMAAEFGRGNRRIFSSALLDAIGERLKRMEKTVLFVNRRGTSNFVLCRSCGYVPKCERCSVSLVLHRSEGALRCHLCDAQRPAPRACPSCASTAFKEFGAGTQRVAEEVARLFPEARIVRMDSDTTTRIGSHARLLDEFGGSADVLVGTQMVAKGLDFAEVTLVGAVAADIGLHVPDFRAAERTFDLISQVIGRSGRARPGEAIVQTYSPEHPAIVFAAAHDFEAFAVQELEARRLLGYPPFGQLAYVAAIGRDKAPAEALAAAVAARIRSESGIEVLGPAPFSTPRVNGEWRFRVAAKAAPGSRLRETVRQAYAALRDGSAGVRLALDLEP